MSSDTTVIIGRKLRQFCFQDQFFTCSGLQFFRLGISCQLTQRLSQLSLRSLHIDLYGLSAGHTANICHFLNDSCLGTLHCQSHALCLEPGIGQSKAKGIFYLVSGKGLKIAITYIDVLGIKILHRIPEILRGRIILNIFRNSIAELTTGIHFSCQDIYCSSAALLAALPYIEHSLWLIPVDPLHIHDITHIQHNDRPGKCIADITKNFFLRSCQQITAFRSTIILVFSCGSAENHNRQIRLFRRLSRQFFADGHFFLVPGLHSPSLSYIKRMILQPFPVLCLQYLIHLYGAVFLETVCNIGHIWSIDHTSGTRTALIMLELGSAEDRHFLPFLQRQHTVFISKQYASLRRHTSCQFRIFLIIQCIFHISVCSLPVISIFLYLLS